MEENRDYKGGKKGIRINEGVESAQRCLHKSEKQPGSSLSVSSCSSVSFHNTVDAHQHTRARTQTHQHTLTRTQTLRTPTYRQFGTSPPQL